MKSSLPAISCSYADIAALNSISVPWVLNWALILFFFQPNCALDYCPAARPSFGGFRCQTNFGIQKCSWSIQWLQEWMLNAVDAKQAQNNTQTNLLEHPLLGRLRHCVNIHLNTADQPKLPNPLLLYTWPDMLIISQSSALDYQHLAVTYLAFLWK